MKTARPKLNVRNLKDLRLFSAYDVSKWCARNKIETAYLEYRGREKNPQKFTHEVRPPRWLVLDSKSPGTVIRRFDRGVESSTKNHRITAVSWAEVFYDVEFKAIRSMKGYFPAPAVDLIMDEMELLHRVWAEDEIHRTQLSDILVERIKEEYPTPHFVRPSKEKVLNF